MLTQILVDMRGQLVKAKQQGTTGLRARRTGDAAFTVFGVTPEQRLAAEQAPAQAAPVESVGAQRAHDALVVPWVVSARSPEALAGQAGRLLAHVGAHPELDVVDVGFSLVSTRSVFEHRAVVVGADRERTLNAKVKIVNPPAKAE